jgi:hypothetical protein
MPHTNLVPRRTTILFALRWLGQPLCRCQPVVAPGTTGICLHCRVLVFFPIVPTDLISLETRPPDFAKHHHSFCNIPMIGYFCTQALLVACHGPRHAQRPLARYLLLCDPTRFLHMAHLRVCSAFVAMLYSISWDGAAVGTVTIPPLSPTLHQEFFSRASER